MRNYENEINTLYGQIAVAKNYLNDTDYMMLREAEGGAPAPEEVKGNRVAAREKVNQCEEEIKQLEVEKEKAEKEWLSKMQELPAFFV